MVGNEPKSTCSAIAQDCRIGQPEAKSRGEVEDEVGFGIVLSAPDFDNFRQTYPDDVLIGARLDLALKFLDVVRAHQLALSSKDCAGVDFRGVKFSVLPPLEEMIEGLPTAAVMTDIQFGSVSAVLGEVGFIFRFPDAG